MTPLIEDPAAAHQIVLRQCGNDIMVSCTCQRIRGPGRAGHLPIESRARWEAAGAVAAWRAWHEERGVIV